MILIHPHKNSVTDDTHKNEIMYVVKLWKKVMFSKVTLYTDVLVYINI